MRTHIGYAIHFNSDFCQIARMENGVPVIVKSDTMKDAMPLCVHFNKRQDVIVGDAAYNALKTDATRALRTGEQNKSNTFYQFDRTLGTNHQYHSTNVDRSYASEELLAECFKKLRSFIRNEDINSIVITVPAKFLNPENEATMKAARLAGFKHIQLLQEPVAAVIGYGHNATSKDGDWLVFDFAEGTFNSALVKCEEGVLSVKDTNGDNWLGGKNLDEAIVDRIIIPYIEDNYAIDSVVNDPTKREILRNAVKPFAEEAKIQLSFRDSYNILSNLGDLPFEDDNGEEPEIDVNIRLKDLENVVAPIFQKAIDITKELLKRNNLKGSELSNLILVGGLTYSPVLRKMLREQITDNVDTSVDPATVIAKGAALFASTIEAVIIDPLETKLQLAISYEATTVELDEVVCIKVLKEKATDKFPDKIYADFVRSEGVWSSGKKQIGEKATLINVQLIKKWENHFDVIIYDEQGNKLSCQPNHFTILHGITVDKMQLLPYHIGIGDFSTSKNQELFRTIKGLEKNKPVPATGVVEEFKIPIDIRPGIASDVVRLPIYQGDYNAEGTNVKLSSLVNEVIITGESLPKFLPKGSPVHITIKVDGSSLMKFNVEYPTIEHFEDLDVEIKIATPITSQYIDDLKEYLVLTYADNPVMGKDKFMFLLKELRRIDDSSISHK